MIADEAKIRRASALKTPSAQSEFGKQLDDLHVQIAATKAPAFTVDVRALSFVNSSAIRVFVNWISRAEKAPYKLVFLTDRTVTWHRLSFSVLKSLAPATVEIEEAKPGELSGQGSAT